MSTKSQAPITQEQVAACVEIINSIPKRNGNHVGWKSAPKETAAVAACILCTTHPKASARKIADAAGLSQTALYCFLNGKDAGGMRWPELQAEVKALGMECYSEKSPREKSIADRVASIETNADAINRNLEASAGLAADAKTSGDHDGTIAATHKGLSVAMAMLATTNKGEVIVTTPPPPSTMAAKPGEYATKTDATRCVLDTKTKDILIITTRRIEFGTPAWCEKMVEINSKPKT